MIVVMTVMSRIVVPSSVNLRSSAVPMVCDACLTISSATWKTIVAIGVTNAIATRLHVIHPSFAVWRVDDVSVVCTDVMEGENVWMAQTNTAVIHLLLLDQLLPHLNAA